MMKRCFLAAFSAVLAITFSGRKEEINAMERTKATALSAPTLKGAVSLEEAIQKRRSIRAYSGRELNPAQISQLLWAAQGITRRKGLLRSAPSAGAGYPMETYLLKKDGVFHYLPKTHSLETVTGADLRAELSGGALGQSSIAAAPVSIVLCAAYEKLSGRYGERSRRYAAMEAGHIAQNIHLQAAALGLGSVPIGAFDDEQVKNVLKLPPGCEPLYIIPAGYPAE